MIGHIHIDPYLMIPTFMFKGDNVGPGYWRSLLLLLIITSNMKADLPNRRTSTEILDKNLKSSEIIIKTVNFMMILLFIIIAYCYH